MSVLKVLMFNASKALVQMSFFSVKLTFPNLQTYSYIRIPMTMSPRGGAHFCPQPMAYLLMMLYFVFLVIFFKYCVLLLAYRK